MTKETELLRKYAENVLYQEKKLKSELTMHEGIHLSIGATKTIGEYVIANHISGFLSDPKNSMNVIVENTDTLLSALSAGDIDFALVEGYFDRSKYASRLYRNEPFVGLCGKYHLFAGHTVSFDRIWKENLILRESVSGTRDILEQLLTEKNRSLTDFQRITTVNNFGLITKLLEKNHCITFAYRAVGENNDALAEFHVKGWNLSREFNYVYLDTPYSVKMVELFDNYVK